MKPYFDIKNPPFGNDLINAQKMITRKIYFQRLSGADFILRSKRILPPMPLIMFLFAIVTYAIATMATTVRQDLITSEYWIFLGFSFFSAIFCIYILFLSANELKKEIAHFLSPINKADCVKTLSLRDAEGHEEIRNYINQTIAHREIERWEIYGLSELAEKIKETQNAEKIQQQTLKEAEQQALIEAEACSKLYVNNF